MWCLCNLGRRAILVSSMSVRHYGGPESRRTALRVDLPLRPRPIAIISADKKDDSWTLLPTRPVMVGLEENEPEASGINFFQQNEK